MVRNASYTTNGPHGSCPRQPDSVTIVEARDLPSLPSPEETVTRMTLQFRSLLRMAASCSAFLSACATSGPVRPPANAAQAEVLAIADAALAALSRGDWVAVTDLMIPEGLAISTRQRDATTPYKVSTRAELRATGSTSYVERGFAGEARIAGRVATVWLPYDFYLDGKWSHCGVDTITLVQTPEGWRISLLAYSVEQPPACARHPAGPPPGAKSP